MCILLSLVLFGPCRRGEKLGNKWNHRSSETIFWAGTHPESLVWMVLDSNNIFYISLGHYKGIAKYRVNLGWQSEAFATSTIYSWVLTIPCMMGIALFVGFYLPLLLFIPLIMIFGWMVYVHSIKFTFHIVPGVPIPILEISGIIILWLIEYPGLNIFKAFSITIVAVTSFSVGVGLVSVASSYLNCCKDISPPPLTYTGELLVQDL